MTDPTIREQSYRYFLQEAPELLQVLEQELLSLREDYSINKIHNLMRTTHTLKGAAASVGLETIKTVAHSLEDIFKALFNPDLSIDPEIEALIFEGYECLRLPLTAEFTGGQVNNTEILDRTAFVFAQLQEKLGDCFGQEAQIPSSAELGFDVTQSIFEVGVTQRLEELAAAITSGNPETIATTLRTQSEVFQGLAESLNLPGFGAIAQVANAALDAHPEQVVTIAQTALADFQAGQAAVLSGDRSQGGQPSLVLQQLAGFTTSSTELTSEECESGGVTQELPGKHYDSTSPQQELVTQGNLHSLTSESEDVSESSTEIAADLLLETIWGGTEVKTPAEERKEEEKAEIKSPSYVTTSSQKLPSESETNVHPTTVTSRYANTPRPISVASPTDSLSRTVRVNVEHLEFLNYSLEELLTNQNRQLLHNEQLKTAVRSLLARLQQHQQLLGQLQDWSDRQFVLAEQGQFGKQLQVERWKVEGSTLQSATLQLPTSIDRFDSLELDRYSEAQLLVQSILEDSVQLAEATEAIDLFTKQSNQTLEKQRRLLTSTRDTLMEARMLPLGELFNRFPRVLKQLEVTHNKLVTLEIQGSDVLVDKVVAQKLYDPLLHLVRNAFDHGIEFPAVRQQQGKPEKGQISICASHQGRYLVIEVRDDGQGLDFEKIRRRAVELFSSPERITALSEAQLTDLLFEPGFSTVSRVNELSGRGIGLDVVRAQVQALQGSIAVSSGSGKGTTFKLQIPLNLTIAKLLLCQAGDQVYALLSDAIASIVIPQSDQIRAWEGGKVLQWSKGSDEQLIPVHQLADALDYCSLVSTPVVFQPQHSFVSQGQMMPIILIRCQDRLMGLEVNQLLGEQELVIRPLGAMIVPPSYVYGSSILADGRLTLVLDGAALMQYRVNQKIDNTTEEDWVSSTLHLLSPNPQQQLLSTQPHAALAAPPAPDLRAIPNPLVLLVDDSITLRQTLALTLQKAGYQVLQAKDGYEAIEQLRYHTDIQLVMCDIEMPRMNGFEFLKYHQQDPDLVKIPVVILTSRSGEKHRLIAVELGATAYITKPFLEHQLLTTVTDTLQPKL